jgi:hypothetical protein
MYCLIFSVVNSWERLPPLQVELQCGGSEGERVAKRVTFDVETPVTESTTVDSQQRHQPLLSESADGVHDDNSGGASEASDSPIAHRIEREPQKSCMESVTPIARGRGTTISN